MFNNKQFLVFHNNNIICTGVNEEIELDEKYLNRIEKKYDIQIVNKDDAMNEEDLHGFYVEAKNDILFIHIVEGHIQNKNQLKWEEIYTCKFFPNKRKIEEDGFGFFELWKEELEDIRKFLGEDLCLNDDYMREVRKVFPSLIGFQKFYDFLEMYENYGFYQNRIASLDKNLKKGKVSPFIGKKYNNMNVKYAQMREIFLMDDVFFEVCLIEGMVYEGRMNIEKKGYAYITKNYVKNVNIENLSDLMDSSIIYSQFHYDEFEKKYPDVMLKNYIASGGKFIIPFLVSMNHNHVMELAGKAGCGYIADRIYSEKNFNWNNLNKKGTNLKKIFGLPIKAMRNLNKKEIQFDPNTVDFSFLQRIYKAQSSIFNMDLTISMIKFIEYESLMNNNFFQKEIKTKLFLNMLRFVSHLNLEEEHLYQDYLQMCRANNLRDDGWIPKNLQVAHDAIMNYMNEKREVIRQKDFYLAVQRDAYQRLIWEYGNYCFLIPRDAEDLVNESYQQRNCVRSYINLVSNGYTYVVFMRLKSRKSSSHITIEVSNNYYLRQAKGKGNSVINDDACKVIKLWCEEKGINYDDCVDVSNKRFNRRHY